MARSYLRRNGKLYERSALFECGCIGENNDMRLSNKPEEIAPVNQLSVKLDETILGFITHVVLSSGGRVEYSVTKRGSVCIKVNHVKLVRPDMTFINESDDLYQFSTLIAGFMADL